LLYENDFVLKAYTSTINSVFLLCAVDFCIYSYIRPDYIFYRPFKDLSISQDCPCKNPRKVIGKILEIFAYTKKQLVRKIFERRKQDTCKLYSISSAFECP
jgi:hypothetical protein